MINNSGFEFAIDLAANCIFVKHHGVFDVKVVMERSQTISQHEQYRKGLNRLIVATDIVLEMDYDDLRKIIKMINEQATDRGNYREAIFINDMVSHGFIRILDSLKEYEGVEYQIFHNKSVSVRQDLRQWLGLEANFQFPDFLQIRN